MNITLHLSLYWLLVPVALGLVLYVRNAASKETGGYLSGLGTVLAACGAIGVFLVVLIILMAVHILSK